MEKQNRNKIRSQGQIKHGLCLACAYREIDARMKFAKPKGLFD